MPGTGHQPDDPYDSLRAIAFSGESRPTLSPLVQELRSELAKAIHSHQKWLLWEQLRRQGANAPPADMNRVLGVISEFTVAGGPVTVVAFPEGDASIYIRGGGGVIGGGAHTDVRLAAAKLIEVAGSLVSEFPVVPVPPTPPGRDEIVFNVLTPNGLRSQREIERTARSKSHRLNELYWAMQDLITRLRRRASATPNQPTDQEMTYVNCLLTVLAENGKGEVALDSTRQVPPLSSLARNVDQRAWLQSEGIDERGLRSSVIIAELVRLSRFGLFRRRKGTLHARLVTRFATTLAYTFQVERLARSEGEELVLRL